MFRSTLLSKKTQVCQSPLSTGTLNGKVKEMKFGEYEEFIYMNTHMDKIEARAFARNCWNKGMDKYEALAEARKESK